MPKKVDPRAPYWTMLEEFERQMIKNMLVQTEGHIGDACLRFGIARETLQKRMRLLGIGVKSTWIEQLVNRSRRKTSFNGFARSPRSGEKPPGASTK